MEYTAESKLSRPLLGVEREVEVARPVDEQEEPECCEVHTTTCCDSFILWLVLPALLFVQFAIAFRLEDQQHPAADDHHHHYSIHNLEWSTVNYSIVLFVLSSYLFRRTLQETVACCNETTSSRFFFSSTFLFLLPEIIMDLLLALVLFGQVVPAFLAMVLFTMGLSLYVVVQSFQTLLYDEGDDDELQKEQVIAQDYKMLQV